MIRIGKIVASHGLGGDVIMTHVTGRNNWLKVGDVLFVAVHKESFIPFYVSNIKSAGKEEMIIHLEDTNTVEGAKKLVTREVFVQEDVLAKSGADSPLLWIGFELVDTKLGVIGPVVDVFQTPTQWLGTVLFQGKEAMIPLITPIFKKVDIKQQKVFVDLPDGLLEVYL